MSRYLCSHGREHDKALCSDDRTLQILVYAPLSHWKLPPLPCQGAASRTQISAIAQWVIINHCRLWLIQYKLLWTRKFIFQTSPCDRMQQSSFEVMWSTVLCSNTGSNLEETAIIRADCAGINQSSSHIWVQWGDRMIFTGWPLITPFSIISWKKQGN